MASKNLASPKSVPPNSANKESKARKSMASKRFAQDTGTNSSASKSAKIVKIPPVRLKLIHSTANRARFSYALHKGGAIQAVPLRLAVEAIDGVKACVSMIFCIISS